MTVFERPFTPKLALLAFNTSSNLNEAYGSGQKGEGRSFFCPALLLDFPKCFFWGLWSLRVGRLQIIMTATMMINDDDA